jgi:hypothetical protein
MIRLSRPKLAAVLAICLLAAGAVWAALDAATPKVDLAAWVPQGALLSIESQDFAALLKDWNTSQEQTAWLKSDDYVVFSRSRLLGRLQQAQKQFATAAGLPVDGAFLKEMAGTQSFFAWYDIGNLQIVYITRMTPAMAEQSRLLQRRKQFETRQAGGVTFYVKTGSGDSSTRDSDSSSTTQTTNDASATADSDASSTDTQQTIAFAEKGDWLILSTDEDIMSQTLELMSKKENTADDGLASEAWYKEAKAAASGPAGDLRMVLNMEEIVKTPQFRTYWIQQNITEMKQYKSAVTDLYRDTNGMREERVLLPEPDSAQEASPDIDLGKLTALVPDHIVIYRALAKPTEADALTALQEKVLARSVGDYEDTKTAPVADISTPQAGNVTDLETRIDEPAVAAASKQDTAAPLKTLLHTASLQAMMTLDRNSIDDKPNSIWVPFASAVILSSEQDWDTHALQDAIQQFVQQKLTAGGLGLAWQQKSTNGITYFTTSDAHGLQMAVSGNLCIVSDDTSLLIEILRKQQAKPGKPQSALMIAGFDHTAAREPFAQWTAIVDGIHPPAATPNQDTASQPPFFGKDMKGLSDAFAAMRSEQFVARRDGSNVRQTVTYTWQH